MYPGYYNYGAGSRLDYNGDGVVNRHDFYDAVRDFSSGFSSGMNAYSSTMDAFNSNMGSISSGFEILGSALQSFY